MAIEINTAQFSMAILIAHASLRTTNTAKEKPVEDTVVCIHTSLSRCTEGGLIPLAKV